MRLRSCVGSFFRGLTGGARLDADLDAELRAHVDLLTDEKRHEGLSPEAARRAALLEVGGIEQVKERVRDVRVGMWLDTMWQDVRYAVRGFRKVPWFTATAIASLAIGIGLNTAIFSAIEAVLLRPLPFREPARIVRIDQTVSTFGGGPFGVSAGVFEDWRQRATSFDSMGVYRPWDHDSILRDGSSTERVDVSRMSSGVFAVLGVAAAIGRTLRPEDDRHGQRVAVMAHEFWARRWHRDPQLIGRELLIDGESYRVVGVMPAGFRFYHEPGMDQRLWSDLYLSDPWVIGSRTDRWPITLRAIGRLKDGVTLERANSEVATLASATDYGAPPYEELGTPKMGGLVSRWDAPARDLLARMYLVWGIASFLLLLAAANMANLQLARAGARRQELGIRSAIGASRARLTRQLFTESLVLSFAGGVAGLAIAAWSGPLVMTLIPDTGAMWQLTHAGINWRVLTFMTAVAGLTGVAFGVAPALGGSPADQRTMLASSVRMTESRAVVRTRAALLVGQVAISLVLLAGAGLMITTLSRLWARPAGFEPEGLITFYVRLPRALPYVADLGLGRDRSAKPSLGPAAPSVRHWAVTPRLSAVRQRLVEQLRAVPGVSAATVATGIPHVRSLGRPFTLPSRPILTDAERGRMVAIAVRTVPGYFATLGIPLLAGRDLSTADQEGSRRVAVINRGMARTYWPDERQALGAEVAFEGQSYEIVGIAGDVRFWMWDGEPVSKIFTPFVDDAATAYAPWELSFVLHQNVAVRVKHPGAATTDAIRRAVTQVTGGVPVERLRSMRTAMVDSSGNTPGMTLLLSSAAIVGLSLSAIGIFGVVTYTVSRRAHEIGIRVALGASRRTIMRLVLSGSAWLALAGVGVGSLAAFWLTRFLAGELFPGSSPADARVFGAVASMLVAIVLAATWVPARRAADVDPAVALRAE